MARILVVLFAAIALAGCSQGSHEEHLSGTGRVVDIEMRDNRFVPDEVSVDAGETIGFRFHNEGEVSHDAFVGDKRAQREHERQAKAGGDGHDHEETNDEAVTVGPGDTGSLTHTFAEAGTYEIGCHQPGHYADGMVARVTVRRES
jgi:uncharacterized cupredoxin-like copper-binding protein